MLLPKMKIRFNTSLAGKNFVYGAGEVIDLPTTVAKDWIGQGLAEEIQEEKKPIQRPLKVQEVKKTMRRPVKRTK